MRDDDAADDTADLMRLRPGLTPVRRPVPTYPRPLARTVLILCHPADRAEDFCVQVEVVVTHDFDGGWPPSQESREAGWTVTHLAGPYTIATRVIR